MTDIFEGIPDQDAGWDQDAIRALWSLDDQVLHLNHGSYGAVPRETRESQDRLREESERNPIDWFRRLPARIVSARTVLAEFCGATADGAALVPNVSAGITAVLASLPIKDGQEIVFTDHTYGAVRLAIERAAGTGAHPVHLPLTARTAEIVELITAAVDERTALVVVDQITSATAAALPVTEIVAACHARGVPVLVDGAHAPGMLAEPARDHNADFWVGNLHKWPCAPRGTAVLAVAPQWRGMMRPLVASWSEHSGFPLSFDQAGTLDLTGWLAAPVSLEVLTRLDPDRVRRHNERLADYGQQVFCAALGVPVPAQPSPAPSMRIVPLPAAVTDAAAFGSQISTQCRCEIPVTYFADHAYLRLSAHAYNRPSDYETAARAIAGLLVG